MTNATIHGPTPIFLEGCAGSRYWIEHPCVLTGNAAVDGWLSGYPLVVFQPSRPAATTPLVIGLQGIGAPYQWNSFLLPTLLEMGIACALFDTPFAGERSLVRNYQGDIVSEIVPLVKRRVRIDAALMPRLMDAVARDLLVVRGLLADRHGLHETRVALFGVSLGALLCSFAFLRDGFGSRLLCAIGHSDLKLFARSYAPALTPLLASAPIRLLSRLAVVFKAPWLTASTEFLGLLSQLMVDSPNVRAANPMTYVDPSRNVRPARFLAGVEDELVRPEDVTSVARELPDGKCYLVPAMGHGGDGFVDHVRYFVATQLGDWRW
jgi:pimeloyl-ACP methyl ester carboxylesterase